MATQNTKPEYIPTPFAKSGLKNNIPLNDKGNYLASWNLGFPEITFKPLNENGLPPDGKDMNGVLNTLSAFLCFLQNGGQFTFDPDLANAIGGYAKNQVLINADDSGIKILRSTKNNNKDNFLTNSSFIGTSWQDFATSLIDKMNPVGSLYLGTQSACPMATLIPGSVWELVGTNRALWGGNGSNANTTIAPGLPSHTHTVVAEGTAPNYGGGLTAQNALARKSDNSSGNNDYSLGYATNNAQATIGKSSTPDNNIYGKSETVQPPAYVVNVWRRTS